ncbi:hypothetical protein IQ227_17395 [Anabaena aphanizomenioides LEGE 00250]|jgi:hypothetical protein|uniref:Uncharacterized protein n=1 Tax=Sphaerospermopsis aphanizomenoides LEGE 00250 TaxID=2777972 RepID=A0ABR9VHR0_9CYAN|nr:hypothetical protein [Sphaerospermopsis aphanizomenoides]MBE9237755.1 hypothetical protein [Sphaerospermopsis aphanizomenoides LEGE 00250]
MNITKNITKLIFLACHLFLASLFLVVSPAQASTRWKTIATSDQIVAASVQPIPELTKPIFKQQNQQIFKNIGCSCSACVQSNFHKLQGKLPSADF